MKCNPVQALQSLLSPLDKLTAVSEAEMMLTQDIHKVLTVDLKSAANDMASELSTQTSILKDIKSLIKDQIKEIFGDSADTINFTFTWNLLSWIGWLIQD
jgi:hypothetical protein